MKTSSSTFEIVPQGEYSLEQGANFIGAWHRAPSASGDPEGHLHLAFLTDDELAPVGVCLKQDSGGRVLGTVHGGAGGSAGGVEQVERILSLDGAGRGWAGLGRGGPILARARAPVSRVRPGTWVKR